MLATISTPPVHADGTIVFASDRSGATGLWAMSDAGESSARQLTAGGDSRPAISPDGAVVFQRGTIQSAPIELWRMPAKAVPPVRLLRASASGPPCRPMDGWSPTTG